MICSICQEGKHEHCFEIVDPTMLCDCKCIPNRSLRLDHHSLLTSTTAVYPDAGVHSKKELNYLLVGLAGEVGELLNKWKKVLREDTPFVLQDFLKDVEKELGDVFWYSSRLCRVLERNPEQILRANYNKLIDRKQRGVLKGSGDNR